jgi:hypothetical protein
LKLSLEVMERLSLLLPLRLVGRNYIPLCTSFYFFKLHILIFFLHIFILFYF